MMDGEPHVSYAMAIFDASLNLTTASPNNQKMRIQATGIGRLNIKSKQASSVQSGRNLADISWVDC